MTEHQWNNESVYLSNVTGEQIVASQKEINQRPDMFVKATQIFQISSMISGKKNVQMYDAFIYYARKKNN